MYIIKDAIIGVTTQGKTIEEAIENLKEALELYFEEKPEDLEIVKNAKLEGILNVEVATTFG